MFAIDKDLKGIEDLTFISIHVRMTDYAYHLDKLYNLTYVSEDYFEKAKQHFSKHFSVWFLSLSLFSFGNPSREGVIIECPLNGQFHDARDVILTSRNDVRGFSGDDDEPTLETLKNRYKSLKMTLTNVL